MAEQLMIPGIIDRKADNEIISQRVTDGYVNATAMCKAVGKRWSHYLQLSTTKPFLDELSLTLKIPVDGVAVNGLIQTITGGIPHLQGTWVHPQIAIHLAQWLSPRFAVLVSQWVMEWMGYNGVSKLYKHSIVNHGVGQYVEGNVYTNTIEGFWSLLKRGLLGIYHSTSKKHLQNYIDEFVFRYNTRHYEESERFNLLLSNTEVRTTYKGLVYG